MPLWQEGLFLVRGQGINVKTPLLLIGYGFQVLFPHTPGPQAA
jgi:hypothetical protein